MSEVPSEIGRFRVLGVLGEGGSGRVYDAELVGPAGFRKPVAIKVLKSFAGAEERERLYQEARVGGRLRHPHVVETHELGLTADGAPYIVMERVEGPSLRALLDRVGRLSPLAVLELGTQLCAALAHLHQAGLAHLDVKPGNVMVDRNGVVKLGDLGIAGTVGALNGARGTPGYAAPEQLAGEGGPASDLFALGVVLWEAATGERLLTGNPVERVAALARVDRRTAEPDFALRLEGTVAGLGPVVRRLLRHAPEERLSSANDVARSLVALVPRARGPALQALRDPTPSPDALARVEPSVRSAASLEVDDFVGRERELATLTQQTNDGARILTIKGAGGTGKTTLARRFAARDPWPGGAVFVELEECTTEDELVLAVARQLGVALGRGVAAGAGSLGGALAALGRALVILDNVEQVVEPAARAALHWTQSAPELVLLVTSRERLRVPGEVVLEIGALRTSEAVELLIARARAAGATLDSAPRPLLEAIVRQLDRIPLAVELAAARLDLWSLETLHAELERSLDALRSPLRTSRPRQATLRGAVEWSWAQLAPWERDALAQLSVFRGGFTPEAAERVLELGDGREIPWTVDVLTSLWNRSMLIRVGGPPRPRFRMFEVIRSRAAEHLDPEGASAAALRHASWCASLGALAVLSSGESDPWLLPEQENLRKGVAAGLELGRPDLAASTLLALRVTQTATGPYDSALVTSEAVLAALPEPSVHRMYACMTVAGWRRLMGQLEGARDAAAAATELAETFAAPRERVLVGMIAASVEFLAGAYDRCVVAFEDLLADATALGMVDLQARLLANLGLLAEGQSRFAEGVASTLRSVELARAHGCLDPLQLSNLGGQWSRIGETEKAHAAYLESIALAERIGNRRVRAMALINLANLVTATSHTPSAALAPLEEALVALRRVGDSYSAAVALANRGFLLHELYGGDAGEGDVREALTYLRTGSKRDAVLSEYAALLLDLARPAEASDVLVSVREAFEQELDRSLLDSRRAHALFLLGRLDEARALLEGLGAPEGREAALEAAMLRRALGAPADPGSVRRALASTDRPLRRRERRWLEALGVASQSPVRPG